MSLTDLMPSTKDLLIAGLQARLTETTTLLARGVHERDLDEAQPGSALWDARVHLGLDGATGARDIRSEGGSGGNFAGPRVLAVDPGVQVEQAAEARIDCAQHCVIPAGARLAEMPPSRHDWSDVVRCPNDGCERTFLVLETGR